MTKKILVAAVAVMIARDAMTNLPVTVPEHEVDIQKAVFGKDNVQLLDEQPDTIFTIDPSQEAERLAAKYGGEAMEKAHGTNFEGAIARELARISKGDAPADEEPEIDADVPGQNRVKKQAVKADTGPAPLDTLTKAQLTELAESEGVSITPAMNKAALIGAIEGARAAQS